MKKFFEWIKKNWKAVLIGIAVVAAGIWGFVKIFFGMNDRTDFVKDPADPNKIIIKDPKTGKAIGVKLPDGMKNDKVSTVSKPVDVITKPATVKNKTVNRKETLDVKSTSQVDTGDADDPSSAADWLGRNNPNFKG